MTCARALVICCLGLFPVGAPRAAPAPDRDQEHAFDFDIGRWHAHSRRLLHPLTGSKQWVEFDGMTVVTPIWAGKANFAQYRATGPTGSIEILALRWFNPSAQQWNINFSHPDGGTLGVPAVGVARAGRIDFYDTEPLNGRSILVRFSIWPTGHDRVRSEQAFSVDGGRTWETNWINTYERLRD